MTVLLAAGLTAAGALPLLLVTAAAEGPVLVAAGCVALAALALVYAFRVGDRVASRRAAVRLTTARTLVPRRARRGSAPVPLLDAVARPTRSRAIGRRP